MLLFGGFVHSNMMLRGAAPSRSYVRARSAAAPSFAITCRAAPDSGATFTAVCREAEPRVLFRSKSEYNDKVEVLEIPDHPLVDECISELRGCRVLLLDSVGNIHSIWKPATEASQYVTLSYWDCLATLPSLMPYGSLAILGLAGGTIPRMIHAHYPHQYMEAWELDPVVVHAARLHMGLLEMEALGHMACHVGDALAEDASLRGRFTGIMVDLFCRGTLVSALTQESTWRVIKDRLEPGGRVMVNLGQSSIPLGGRATHPDSVETDLALKALASVFSEVSILHMRNMDGAETQNSIALTGPFEGLQATWESSVPDALQAMTRLYAWERVQL